MLKLIPVLLILISCGAERAPQQQQNADTLKIANIEQVNPGNTCKFDIIGTELNEAVAERILASPDSCILAIIDALRSDVMVHPQSFNKLNVIRSKSDGAISEYFLDVMVGLFQTDYRSLSSYLSENRDATLNEALVQGLSMDLSEADDIPQARAVLRQKIAKESANDTVRKHMMVLEKRLDPHMFD